MALRTKWSNITIVGASLLLYAAPAWGEPSAATADDGAALAPRIDKSIEARLAEEKVPAAARADDAEFLRRVYLDLTGRTPSVAQVRRFLADHRSDKRERLIESLLKSGAYEAHFARVWRAILLPETGADNNGFRVNMENWLRRKLRDNTPYDEIVRELIRPGSVPAFYQAYENKPENLAAATSRLFLGVKLECAQCHRHPFAKWTREQFWGYAAFFSGLPQPRQRGKVAANTASRKIQIPGTDKVVQARFLNAKQTPPDDGRDARLVLAEWITAPDNPYFARAAVNRLWAHFFGIGLVDPVDDLGDQNAPSHPELLDELARQFRTHHYDLKFLIRAIVLSRAYQRTSVATVAEQDNPRLFARMELRGLTAEQLFDSLAVATGYREAASTRGKARAAFLARFAQPGAKPTEFHLSILQALSLMNGTITAAATDLDRSETLAAVVDAPFMDTAARVETLYLAALGRPPNNDESARFVRYVNDGGADKRPEQALADVFWTLLNSGEFILNH